MMDYHLPILACLQKRMELVEEGDQEEGDQEVEDQEVEDQLEVQMLMEVQVQAA